jgi:hypothetical protein
MTVRLPVQISDLKVLDSVAAKIFVIAVDSDASHSQVLLAYPSAGASPEDVGAPSQLEAQSQEPLPPGIQLTDREDACWEFRSAANQGSETITQYARASVVFAEAGTLSRVTTFLQFMRCAACAWWSC